MVKNYWISCQAYAFKAMPYGRQCFHVVEWYQLDRVLMQFGMIQPISRPTDANIRTS